MKKILIAVLALMMTVSCSKKENAVELTVSAAASLKNAMEDAKAVYEQSNPKVRLLLNYASSGSLQHQIEEGAPVDVFVSASPKQINALKEKSLLDDATIKDLFKNAVVLIVPADSDISGFKDLPGSKVKKFALGDPASVPAGQYGMQVLESLKLAAAMKGKTVYAKDVREVLSWVESSNADAGIVYKTDAMISSKVKIVEEAPDGSHKPVIYPGAVIKDSIHMPQAKSFVEWLASDAGAADIFKKYGFNPAG